MDSLASSGFTDAALKNGTTRNQYIFADTGSCLRAAAGVFERAPVRSLSELDEPGGDGWAGLVTGKAV